jgi:hypothetical protein
MSAMRRHRDGAMWWRMLKLRPATIPILFPRRIEKNVPAILPE